MSRFGLIGQSLKHSFSKQYFTDFFEKENLPHSYSNYEMENLEGLRELIQREQLSGLNMTIPFKEDVLKVLDEIDPTAKEIGAVNVIKVENGKLIGYNTDRIGFEKSLLDSLGNDGGSLSGVEVPRKALVLGTGGASKAIIYSLKNNGIDLIQVSRATSQTSITYEDLTEQSIVNHQLIINCTPLGTSPNVEDKPKIPYAGIGSDHILYDLVYNPPETAFLKEGKIRGATILNGGEMLRIQAAESWRIWNK